MDTKKLQISFFIGLLLIILALTVALFEPFLAPIALSFMAAIIVRPVNRWMLVQVRGKRTLAALLTVLFVLVVVMIPVGFLVQQIAVEGLSFVANLQNGQADGFEKLTTALLNPVHRFFPNFNPDIEGYVRSLASGILANSRAIFSSTASFGLSAFLATVGLFYMLRDGHKFKQTVVELSPLADAYDNEIIATIEKAVNSVVRGSLFTSVVKGVLAGLGFAVFGVPHALLWGTLTAFVSLLPGIGAGLTLVPAVIFLVLQDSVGMAIGLGLWGAIAVGLVDNFVMPFIVSRGFTVHPLFVLLSVVGGIIFFGPVGLFLGPLVVAMLSALLEIYKLIIIDDKDKKKTTI